MIQVLKQSNVYITIKKGEEMNKMGNCSSCIHCIIEYYKCYVDYDPCGWNGVYFECLGQSNKEYNNYVPNSIN